MLRAADGRNRDCVGEFCGNEFVTLGTAASAWLSRLSCCDVAPSCRTSQPQCADGAVLDRPPLRAVIACACLPERAQVKAASRRLPSDDLKEISTARPGLA